MTRPGPGMFEGNDSLEVSEVLHAWVQNGLTDDQTGEVDGPAGWHALIKVADGDEAYAQLIEADSDVVTSNELGILVHQDEQGFFTYEFYESFGAAETVFRSWEEAANPPTCDICDEPESTADGEENDWNGDTGNHVSCEEQRRDDLYEEQARERPLEDRPRPELDGIDNHGRDFYMEGD